MGKSRLTTALDGGPDLPETGGIAIFYPSEDTDLSGLPMDRVRVIHSDIRTLGAWRARGVPADRTCEDAALAIVIVPRAKRLARALVARAAALVGTGTVVVDGQKTDGIDALHREVRGRIGQVPSVTRGHGRCFWFAGTDAFADWASAGPEQGAHGYVTQPGVFSEEGIDPGSEVLVGQLPRALSGRVGDLGAGWGYLSSHLQTSDAIIAIDLVEAEGLALDCARLNVIDPRARFHWADATRFRPDEPWDTVVMNPPFHAGRTGDPGIGVAFIAAAARGLRRSGDIWMVANRHLPYEAALTERFAKVVEVGHDGRFKVFHASRPKR